MDKPYALFYSKYCAYSRKVTDLIDNSAVRSKCIKICVDDKPRTALPKTIQAVPTLIDRSSGQVHVGESITTALFGGNMFQQNNQFAPQQESRGAFMQSPSPQSTGSWPGNNGHPPQSDGASNGSWPSNSNVPHTPQSTGSWPGNGVPPQNKNQDIVELPAYNQTDGQFAMMAGEANMNMLDESYKSISDQIGIGNTSTSQSKSHKGDATTNAFEQMMADRQKEQMSQRQRF